ncbi:MAG: aspartate/glutamate racemase family protein [Thermodesulfobacteriota bacterium]
MTKKVGFVHTVVALADRFKQEMAKFLPDVRAFHIVDESLINDVLELGELTSSVVRRLSAHVVLAREGGADLIMVTCSSTSPGVDVARKLVDVPVLKIDDPMAEKAVEMAESIGVLATVKTTLIPSTGLIKSKAKIKDKSVRIESILCEQAFTLLLQGDKEGHDRLVKDAALELAKKIEVLVLAQASMSHLAPEVEKASNTPVLTSPKLAMEAIGRLLGRETENV